MNKKCLARLLAVLLLTAVIHNSMADSAMPNGDYSGSDYVNTYLDFGCSLEGWHYDTLTELITRNQKALDGLPEDTWELVTRNQSYILMFAESPDDGDNVSISVTRTPGAADTAKAYGMKAIVDSLLGNMKNQYLQMWGYNTSVQTMSVDIGSQTFYGFDCEARDNGFCQKQIMIAKDDYVVAVTATADTHDDTLRIFRHFYLPSEGKAAAAFASDAANTGASAGDKTIYTGKKRAVTFQVPPAWKQQKLSQEYTTLETKFVSTRDGISQIQYSCKDLIGENGLPDTMRPLFSMKYFTEKEAADFFAGEWKNVEVQRIQMENNTFFVVRGDYILDGTATLIIENGYVHMWTLYEMDKTCKADDEQVLFSVTESAVLPAE